eukprot:jgi/Botrbrau1/2647/Bobra.0203s0001.1
MDTIEEAICCAFSATDGDVKARAAAYCEELKRSPEVWQICLNRFCTSQYTEVRFWCLQTLHQLILEQYALLRPDEKLMVRQQLMYWGNPASPPPNVPFYIQNKLAQVIVAVLQVDYPSGWPTFFSDLIHMLSKGPDAVDMFCRILISLDEDIISLETPRNAQGDRRSMDVKDAMRENCMGDLIRACHELIAGYYASQPGLAASVLEALRRFVNWADIALLTTDEFVQLLTALVETGSTERLVGSAAEVLTELVAKRMEPLPKISLIQNMRVVPLAASWTDRLIRQADANQELVRTCALLLGSITTELLEAQKRVENGVVSMVACGLAVDEEATNEASAASSAAQNLLRQCFPSMLQLLQGTDDSVCVCLTPFLAAYLTQLKIVQKRSNGLLREQVEHLQAIMEAVADRATFVFTSGNPANQLIAEEEDLMLERRQDLFTLFRNAAKIVPDTASAVVQNRLQQIMSDLSTPFPKVEIGITLLYQLGEGAAEEALKPGSGTLGALASVLMQHEVPSSGHRLVALALMETYVRYARVLQQEPQYIPTVLAAFLGPRGMAHPDSVVSVRACYLFSRLCKPLRQHLRPILPNVLASLQGHLDRIAKNPLSDSGSSSFKAGLGARSSTGPTAVYAMDDRLYAYEAAGMLLGQDDLPKEEQRAALAALIQPLVMQIQENLRRVGGQGQPQSEALLQQALEAVTRLSKGFSLQLCSQKRPNLGALLAAPLDAALHIPKMLPNNKGLRGRVISYLHRMVECLGETIIPFLKPALLALLPLSAEPADICDALALLNQLVARYKAALQPLLLEVIPIAVERVHTALGPTWDWSGAAAAPLPTLLKDRSSNGPASSSEEAREKSDVQRAYYSFLHALATASLSPCLFQVCPGATSPLCPL